MRMLVGANLTLLRHKPTLMIEVDNSHLSRANDNSSILFTYLENIGYHPYKWDHRLSKFNYISTSDDGDIFFIDKKKNI